MICFRISIFEPLKTTESIQNRKNQRLWFAFELVSLNHWKQRHIQITIKIQVVICFRISIFEPLKTTLSEKSGGRGKLWFAFELVSLNHWKQPRMWLTTWFIVVICFRISIFEPLKTTISINHKSKNGCDLLSN